MINCYDFSASLISYLLICANYPLANYTLIVILIPSGYAIRIIAFLKKYF